MDNGQVVTRREGENIKMLNKMFKNENKNKLKIKKCNFKTLFTVPSKTSNTKE